MTDLDRTFTILPSAPDSPRSEFVYFAYSGGRIKIGYSRGVSARQKRLSTDGPFDPVLILILPGTYGDEQDFHIAFSKDRMRGEWFSLSDDIRKFLRRRLCDIGRASLDKAEADFKAYCEAFLSTYEPPPRRSKRPHCEHGMPYGAICSPCERERDLRVLADLRSDQQSNHGEHQP